MEPSVIAEACAHYQNEVDLLDSLQGRFDPESRTVTVVAEALDDDEVHERVLEIYFDFPFHLPMAPPQVERYRMELLTTTEGGQACHRYVMESAVEELPDTGGSSETRWASFLGQFLYTLDGAPQTFPMPEDFPPEE
jgi:hypothetical protein